MLPYPSPALSRQRGTSLIEFSVVAAPLLLLGLGALEISLWFFTKQAVSLALLEAGRAASVDHARPHSIEAAFEQALLPLFTTAKATASQRLLVALDQRQHATGAAPWQIQRLSPTPTAFQDFNDTRLNIAGATGLAIINNNYLAEQHERHQQLTNGTGHGSASGLTIFQANTLVLRLHWLHQPVVPGVASLLRLLGNPQGSYSQRAMALGGYLPISQDISLMMQSHPVNWPDLANGKVIGQETPPITSVALSQPPCTGIWCMATPQATQATTDLGNQAGSNPYSSTDGVQPNPNPGTSTGGLLPEESTPTPDPDNMACGISLCCVD